MTHAVRFLLELVSRQLDPDAREAVLGDLSEDRASDLRSVIEISWLVVRRHAALWHDWRPWLAALAVALPATFLLMGVSFSISCTFQRLMGWPQSRAAHAATAHEDSLILLCQFILLLLWSWAAGFVVGCVSRRTLWASCILCAFPCAYCLTRFHETSLTRLCLLLFVPPAIAGIYRSVRTNEIKQKTTVALLITATVLMFGAWVNGALWAPNWMLILPVSFTVLLAWRPDSWRASSN
jgi:hypothetical protein